MTVDQSKEQIDKYIVSADQTMATTSTFTPTNHFTTGSTSLDTSSQESLDLTTRIRGLDLKEKIHNSGHNTIPRRQPTIVCEDIADDIDFDEEDSLSGENASHEAEGRKQGVTRSPSTASLTVPQTPESEEEKRRPPLPNDDQMFIESN